MLVHLWFSSKQHWNQHDYPRDIYVLMFLSFLLVLFCTIQIGSSCVTSMLYFTINIMPRVSFVFLRHLQIGFKPLVFYKMRGRIDYMMWSSVLFSFSNMILFSLGVLRSLLVSCAFVILCLFSSRLDESMFTYEIHYAPYVF